MYTLIFSIYFIVIGLVLCVYTVMYIFRALGLYSIAKRRGIKNPWLSWIPVGRDWIMGSIADDYEKKVNDRKKNSRKILLGFSLVLFLSSAAAIIFSFIILIDCTLKEMYLGAYLSMFFGNIEMAYIITILILADLFLIVLKVCSDILRYVALYKIYKSCSPLNAVLYIVISLIVSIAQHIILFLDRKKDLGMKSSEKIEYIYE